MSLSVLGRFGRFFAAMVLLSLAAIWLIFAGISYTSYRSEWDTASLIANNAAILLARDIARDFEIYDLSLKAVVKGLSDPEIMALPDELQRSVLFDQSATASGRGSILVIDEHGKVTLDSRSPHASSVNLADRDYFQVHRDGRLKDGLFIGRPFQSRFGGGEWSIGLSRRLSHPDGSFAGVVIGAVRLDYILSLFKDIHLPADSTVTLFDHTGAIVVRAPFDVSMLGRQAASAGAFEKRGIWSGEFTSKSDFDGVRRLYVYRQIGDMPILQSVGLSIDRFLAEWWTRVSVLAAAFILLSGLIIVLSLTLRKELGRRSKAEQALTDLATTDGLTHIANRRRFDDVLGVEWRRALRTGSTLSLLMIDCDHFKAYNDRYGHLEGDAVLQEIATAIKAALWRGGDLAARFGGEEFVVLLPASDLRGASLVAEAIRVSILALKIPHANAPRGQVTISIGVASRRPTLDQAPSVLVEAADKALYEAKGKGRNAVALDHAQQSMMQQSRVARRAPRH